MTFFIKSLKNNILLSVFFILFILVSQAQQHWQEVYSYKSSCAFYDITFSDSLNGFIVGQDGIMFKTVDGGDTWDSISSGTKQTLFSVSFSDKNNGYACGKNGTIIKTSDVKINSFTPSLLKSLTFIRNPQFMKIKEGII